jgi:ParB family chromosome partitioning protein
MTIAVTENPDTLSADLSLPPRQPTRARTWTGDVEWYTPPEFLEAAEAVLGAIDLDPASSDAQQAASSVKATNYFTIENNGLDRPWRGRIWLNPPYARGWIDRFVTKMVRSYRSGEMSSGILLTNSATETKWWQEAAGACEALCFPKGHVRFLKMMNGSLSTGGSSPSHPHTLFYFGPDTAGFARVFRRFGLVFPKPTNRAG